MNVNFLVTKDYEENANKGYEETNPNKPNQAVLSTACPERSRTGRMDPISNHDSRPVVFSAL